MLYNKLIALDNILDSSAIWVFQLRVESQGGTSILGGRGGLAPNFASEILVGAQILPPTI